MTMISALKKGFLPPSIRTLDALVDAAILAFALWTICCHATVLTHGDGWRLISISSAAFGLVGSLVLLYFFRAGGLHIGRDDPAALPQAPSVAFGVAPESIHLLALVSALIVLCAWWMRPDGHWFWLGSIGFISVSAVWLLSQSLQAECEQGVFPSQVVGLVGLAIVCGLVTACMELPNSDDVLYVNIAVSLADSPSYELYARDTLHGGSMTLLAPYAVHSFELLAGLVSRITTIPALAVLHLGFGPIAGFLVPIAWARFLRNIEPGRWVWLTTIIVSLYLFEGSSERGLVGHAFVRLFQGKAVLLTVLVPILSAYAIEYSNRPSSRRWLLLASGVISGVGLSSTGLWLAPAVAGTALLVSLKWKTSWWRGLALGLLSCAYPVVLGLRVRSHMVEQGAVSGAGLELGDAVVGHYWGILRDTFLGDRATVAYLMCLAIAWPLARTTLARRYLVAFSLVGVVVFFNPALDPYVMAYVTGTSTHSRFLWYLPFTLAFAICFAAPIPSVGTPKRHLLGLAATLVALITFYAAVPTQSTFALAPLVFPPRLKVYHEGYDVAHYLTEHLKPGSFVLAPAGVSLALPLLQHHPYPIMTKPKFFGADSDGALRFRLRRFVDGKISPVSGKHRAWALDNIRAYRIDGIVLTGAAERVPGMTDTLREAGFKGVHQQGDLRVWLRGR